MSCNTNDFPVLTDENLPACWQDEARMNVLFAPLRNRSVNPQDWNSKISFWSNLITTYCTHNKVYAFKLSDLNNIFHRNGRSPSCLNIVVEEMYKSGELKIFNDFYQKPQHSWSGWATDLLIKKPVLWSYNTIKNNLITTDQNQTYIHMHAVKINAEKLLNNVPDNYKDELIDLEELAKISDCEKIDNLKILIHYLLTQNKADIKEISNKIEDKNNYKNYLVKFCNKGKIKMINEVDIGIHTLKRSEQMLINDIEKLEMESIRLINETKLYLAKSQKQMAKTSLRKKHEIDKTINKRANALSNVQNLLSHVQGVDSDNEVFQSYKLAISSLRNSLKNANLNEDAVTDTMVELEEVLNIHSDIQAALSQSITENDSDLEEELAELIDANKSLELPSPPSSKDNDDLLEQLNNLHMDIPKQLNTSIKPKVSL